jgi:hypothetical protein
MYLENINGKLKSQEVKIKYDCNGGFDMCGQERMLKLRYAEKNFQDNQGKHVCRKCFMTFKNPGKKEEVKQKIKKTNLERYGSTMPINQEHLIEQRREQFKNPEFKEQWLDKHKKTALEKYGVDHPMKTEKVKKKQQESLMQNHGVDVPLKSEKIKAKAKKTIQEKYGVDNVAQVPEIRSKMAKTTLDRYGVEHYNQLPEMKDYLRENCREWLAESWKNPWSKGITRPEEWNQKQSESITKRILAGDLNPEDKRFYVTGWYSSTKCKKSRAFFRSSLELTMHYILDTDNNIAWYENEPFAIRYEKSPGIIRNYIPDFFAFRFNGIPLLAEIKPAFRMREKEVEYKIIAGEKFCQENGFEFTYIDEEYLAKRNLDLQTLKTLPQVELCQARK